MSDTEKATTAGPRGLLDVPAAAEYLGVKPRMIRTLVASNAIPYHKIGRWIRLSIADMDAYLAAHRVEASD